jgi:hypothetical protein
VTHRKTGPALLMAIASGLAAACTAQAPWQQGAVRQSANALPTYASHRYYEAPTSIAASLREHTAR